MQTEQVQAHETLLRLSNTTYVLRMFIFTISKINIYQDNDMHESNKGTAVRELSTLYRSSNSTFQKLSVHLIVLTEEGCEKTSL